MQKFFLNLKKKKNIQNTYKLESKDYTIELKNDSFLISNNKTGKIKLKKIVDKTNNKSVILNIEKYFKKKKNNLVDANTALELWKTFKKIK